MPRTKPKEVARRTRRLRQRELHRRLREQALTKAPETKDEAKTGQ